jgi:uncharacterized secreted protein with C-terminal beta-propeller domain
MSQKQIPISISQFKKPLFREQRDTLRVSKVFKFLVGFLLCVGFAWCTNEAKSQDIAQNVELVGQLGGTAWDVHIVGNYAYLAYTSGLYIVDISDNSNPRFVDKCLTPGKANGVYVSGNYAYVTEGYRGLRVIDVSDPKNPFEVGYYDTH